MSEMEMKAAKYEIIERYQEQRKALALIETRLRQFGPSLKALGSDLEENGWPLNTRHKIPDFSQITALLADHGETRIKLGDAKAEMDRNGIPLL